MESGRDNVEVKGAVKETVAAAFSATLKVEGNSTNVVVGGNDKQQLDEEEDDMGKQNGEELDEGAQERMLSNESAAKITSNEKTATEVRQFFRRFYFLVAKIISPLSRDVSKLSTLR